MQTFPQPPKSYSLIKNLLPSVSLLGETSQVQDQETTLHPNPQITSQVDSLIQCVSNLSLSDLNSALSIHLAQFQQLYLPLTSNNPLPSDQLIIQRLKQLKLITQVMVQRMNEKYHEAQNSYKQLDKSMKARNRRIGIRSFFYWKKLNKEVKQVKSNRVDESQSTEKKLVMGDERLAQSDKKRTTRKQEEKKRSLRLLSKKQ